MLAITMAMLLQASAVTLPAPPKHIITNPDWAQRPSGDDVGKYYPKKAAIFSFAGQATVSCIVLADGHLSECTVSGEEPAGMGFADAAMKLSGKFLMKPQTRDGEPVSGGTVRIPIRFIFPGYRLEPLRATHPKLKDGHADLNCRVAESLLLENCFLESLSPRDEMLRDTAMKLAVRFRLPAGSKWGIRVVLPIDFSTGVDAPADSQSASSSSTPQILDAKDLKFERIPSGRDFARVFPLSAQRAEIEGNASILCPVQPGGVFGPCQTESETPSGQGFGAAAVALGPLFHLAPNGAAPGATVRVRIRFNLPKN